MRTSSAGSCLRVGSFELAELSPRLDTRVLDEQRTPFAIALECLGLTSRAVEREHELRTRAFPQRLLADAPFELRDQLSMLAERERAIDSLLGRRAGVLLESCGGDLRVTLERDICERVAAPEGERLIV